jgi:hypothetical protein
MKSVFNRLKGTNVIIDLVNGKTLSGRVGTSEMDAVELHVTSVDPVTKEQIQEVLFLSHAVIGIVRRDLGQRPAK